MFVLLKLNNSYSFKASNTTSNISSSVLSINSKSSAL